MPPWCRWTHRWRTAGEALIVLSDRTRERLVERMRADFVANVSHELRTPLASLIGFTETLRGAAADDRPAQQRFLGIMAEQGARMNRLIDDLLSLSRIELTEHQPPSELLDLKQLLPRLVATFEPRLAERKIRLAMRDRRGSADGLRRRGSDGAGAAKSVGQCGQVRPRGRDARPSTPHEPMPVRAGRTGPGLCFRLADEGSGIPKRSICRGSPSAFTGSTKADLGPWAAPGSGWRSSSISSTATEASC